MAAQILATADTAASSPDVVVTSSLVVALKGVTGGEAVVTISVKDDAGTYQNIGSLTSHSPSTVISAPGTYRFTRKAGATCGVFSG